MLLKDETKNNFGRYLADIIINFIRLSKRQGVLDLMIRCSEDRNSDEYKQLRLMLSETFRTNFDNQELLLIYKEVETLLGGSINKPVQDENLD